MFYDIFIALCSEHKISPSKVAINCGFNKSTITNWKKKGFVPRQDTLIKIADYFGVTVDFLLGKETANKIKPTDNDRLSENKKKLIEFANSVPEDRIDFVLKVMKSILEDD